jgi:hypothetical protein
VFLAPLGALVTVRVLLLLARVGSARGLAQAVGPRRPLAAGWLTAGVAAVLGASMLGGAVMVEGLGVGDPSDIRLSRERWDIAARYGTAFRPAVTVPVAVGEKSARPGFGAFAVSRLISFSTGQPQNAGSPGFVCRDVRLAAGEPGRAVVITQGDPGSLRSAMVARGCGSARVVRVPR